MVSNRAPPASVPAPDPLPEAVAAKLLGAWLANRRQTLMPHTLNFRTLAAAEVALVIEVMAAAAQADGAVDERERQQAALALKLVEANADEISRYAAALTAPQPWVRVLGTLQAAGIAAHAYAGALLVINREQPVNQAFLAYLAARLALPPDLARALESRYRA